MRQLPVRAHESIPKLKRALNNVKRQTTVGPETFLDLTDCDELVLTVTQTTLFLPKTDAAIGLYDGKRVLFKIINQIGNGINQCAFPVGSHVRLPLAWGPLYTADCIVLELIYDAVDSVWYVTYVADYNGTGFTAEISQVLSNLHRLYPVSTWTGAGQTFYVGSAIQQVIGTFVPQPAGNDYNVTADQDFEWDAVPIQIGGQSPSTTGPLTFWVDLVGGRVLLIGTPTSGQTFSNSSATRGFYIGNVDTPFQMYFPLQFTVTVVPPVGSPVGSPVGTPVGSPVGTPPVGTPVGSPVGSPVG